MDVEVREVAGEYIIKMQFEKETPSVIARLMGFDDLPTQPTPHKQRKVLSEGYFRKTASIGRCEKSGLYSRCSSRINSNQKRSKDKDETEEEATMIGRNAIRKQSRGGKHVLRSLQKLEGDSLQNPVENFGVDNLHKLLIWRLGLKQKTRISPDHIFLTGDRKKSDIFRDKSGKVNKETTQKEKRTNEMEHSRRLLSRRELTIESKPDKSGLVRVAKKRIFERWRTTKMFKECEVDSTRCTLGEMLANSGMRTNPKSLSNKLNDDNFCKLNSDVLDSADGESSNNDLSSSEFQELPFEPILISLGEDDEPFEKSSNHFHVEGFGFSNSTKIVPEFVTDSRENNQSPNSVLDPFFQEEGISISESFDSAADDFYSRPQKSKSDETYAEGTGMAISSDEDTEKGSVSFSQDTGKLLGPFGAEECRNFSYLVDVLDEAGFTSTNQEIGFGKWHSSKYPMNPLVFEALEKKYGTLMYWLRSERRLLFDQINEGLKEILSMCISLKEKPLRKRMSSGLRRDEIEEELWTTLIGEEKEAYKSLPEKALGTETKWLQLGDDIYYDICREIEGDLFDVLIGELAGVEGV